METSFNVRVYKTEVYEGKKVTSYYVRWKVGGKLWRAPFVNSPQADAFRSSLVTAARNGEAFDMASGLPVSKVKAKKADKPWFDFATEYADRRWPKTSASQRKNTAQVLMMVTIALTTAPHEFKPVKVRTALREWAFNKDRRESAPADLAEIIKWAKRNSPSMGVWNDTEVIATVLDAISAKLDGKSAASSSVRRDRAIVHNMLRSAVERHVLDVHPFALVQIDKVKSSRAIDKRSLLNPHQTQLMLRLVKVRPRNGLCLHAFLAVLYYAGLRPEEAVMLYLEDLDLPEAGWGEAIVHTVAPEVGGQWTDSGKPRDERAQLKGRDRGESRSVPLHPALVRILRAYIANPNPRRNEPPQALAAGSRLFSGERGGVLAAIVYRRAWQAARKEVLTPEEFKSPLGRRVYVLRHICLTNQLNSGVPPAQVAAWAGNSVPVLLATYVNCISGTEAESKRRILDAFPDPGDDEAGQAREQG